MPLPPPAEVFVGGEGNEIFRMSMEGGQFMAPLVSCSPSVNCLDIASTTQLLIAGGDDGVCEVWDPRTRNSVAKLDSGSQTPVRRCFVAMHGCTVASAAASAAAAADV